VLADYGTVFLLGLVCLKIIEFTFDKKINQRLFKRLFISLISILYLLNNNIVPNQVDTIPWEARPDPRQLCLCRPTRAAPGGGYLFPSKWVLDQQKVRTKFLSRKISGCPCTFPINSGDLDPRPDPGPCTDPGSGLDRGLDPDLDPDPEPNRIPKPASVNTSAVIFCKNVNDNLIDILEPVP